MRSNINKIRRYKSTAWPLTDIVIGPLGSFDSHYSNRNSLFHSLQDRIEKRFPNGFPLLSSFVWFKTIDGVPGLAGSGNAPNSGLQDPSGRKLERSLAHQHLGNKNFGRITSAGRPRNRSSA